MDLELDTIACHDVTKPFPLPDESIDVVVTSPPYWSLRKYGEKTKSIFGGKSDCKHKWINSIIEHDNLRYRGKNSIVGNEINKAIHPGKKDSSGNFCKLCGAWQGQLGLEPHPQMFIDHLVEICCEIKRVLKKSGSFYLNLGDTYYGSGGASGDYYLGGMREGQPKYKQNKSHKSNWLQPKQLLGMPWRVIIALQNNRWILQNSIIWYKKNSLPSSAKDRLNNTYEFIFHLVKSQKYYYDLDAIREPHKSTSLTRIKYGFNHIPHAWEQDAIPISGGKNINIGCHPKGRNPGDVVKHDVAVGRIGNFSYNDPLHTKEYHPNGKNPGDIIETALERSTSYNEELRHFSIFPAELIIKPLKASCPPDGVVLDPFCGRGTVGRVAKQLGMHYILFDIKPEYCELARLYIGGQKLKIHKNQKKLIEV